MKKWRFKTQQTPRKEVAQSHPKIIYKSTKSGEEINWHKSWSFQVKKSLRQFFWVGIRLVYTARKGISTVATALEPHEASNALLQDSIFQKSPQSTHTHRISINFNNINSTVSHILSNIQKLSCLSVFSNQPPLVSLLLYFANPNYR